MDAIILFSSRTGLVILIAMIAGILLLALRAEGPAPVGYFLLFVFAVIGAMVWLNGLMEALR